MNLLRPPLVLPAHAGGRELGGPGRRWWPPKGPRSRTPSYCSASLPGAASNNDPPMISSRTRMTRSPGVPLLPGVGPPERMVRIACCFLCQSVVCLSCERDRALTQGSFSVMEKVAECREGCSLRWTGELVCEVFSSLFSNALLRVTLADLSWLKKALGI